MNMRFFVLAITAICAFSMLTGASSARVLDGAKGRLRHVADRQGQGLFRRECRADCNSLECLDFCSTSQCSGPRKCKRFQQVLSKCLQGCRSCNKR
jgi:hypothetical protein